MTPAARLQAAIEIVDEVVAAARGGGAAADTLIARYFKTRRYAGSKDRRAVRELAYAAIRRAGELPASGRAALIGLTQDRPELIDLFDGSHNCPVPIGDEPAAPAGIAPAWLEKKLAATLGPGELPALLDRAPLDLRVNRLKATRDEIMRELPDAVPGALSPDALRLPEGSRVEDLPAFNQGRVEVQDEGSQLIVAACAAASGMIVVDLCAGAGGKTLALAAAMAGQGRLIACDVDRSRLSRLAPRAQRAGATFIEARLLDGNREAQALADLAGQADVVLIDAPCSGTGTWRRNPEARWRLTPDRLDRLRAMQATVLRTGAPLVKPGGRLVYAVCSLLDEEGKAQIDAFRAANPEWTLVDPLEAGLPHGPGRRLTPAHDGTDGFFIAALARTC
ncbi:MAG TPA: RsmB/NOP family class I SAM-dependent RNA methyltransferase [Sphingomonas sp.]|uniref:RsmB/NOP family class I SAM-dependent RNA methyltransferase n=1 Tax=Sphingomonas sp. TaxID=28214 RepID=UPI002C09DCE2|nr:RsmB/NOP family class I SAM-dependent RNA methyltransferase [Sphingomonas sp.]HMI20732.1 RsmB/NOP family class I SAM-dependent RNA methyltransferase [Sphingomonas sp.]